MLRQHFQATTAASANSLLLPFRVGSGMPTAAFEPFTLPSRIGVYKRFRVKSDSPRYRVRVHVHVW